MKVYIAGPYTKGDVAANVSKAITAAENLARHGYTPYIPHLTHFWHLIYQHEIDFWYKYDMEWLETCDCVLRLEGESYGADAEVKRALELGKKVYFEDIGEELE